MSEILIVPAIYSCKLILEWINYTCFTTFVMFICHNLTNVHVSVTLGRYHINAMVWSET